MGFGVIIWFRENTIWYFNIVATEHGPFIDGLPISMVIFHGKLLNYQGVN
jgi:hypothetical protein